MAPPRPPGRSRPRPRITLLRMSNDYKSTRRPRPATLARRPLVPVGRPRPGRARPGAAVGLAGTGPDVARAGHPDRPGPRLSAAALLAAVLLAPAAGGAGRGIPARGAGGRHVRRH